MNKLIKFCFIFAIIFAGLTKVNASIAVPGPTCYIEGEVKSVEFKDAYNEPCLLNNSCPSDTETSHPARYTMGIKINSFSYIGGDQSFSKCSDLYTVGREASIKIDKADIKSGDVFKIGQKVSGNTKFTNALMLNSYTIKSSNATNTKATTTKTTPNTETTKSKGGFWGFISRLFSFLF